MQQRFLIIGAMKCGTTTLYQLLERSPDVYMPANKEPESLLDPNIYKHRKSYLKLIGDGTGRRCIGEASTAYTKYPVVDNIPQRAADILGKDTKLIYIIRDPVKRAISHVNHDMGLGRVERKDVKRALFADPVYSQVSDYELQLRQWLRVFSKSNIHVVRLENLIRDPVDCIEHVCRFLGAEPPAAADIPVANKGDGKLIPFGPVRTLIRSRLYRNKLKGLIEHSVVQKLKPMLSKSVVYENLQLSEEERAVLAKMCNGVNYERSPYCFES